MAERIRREIGTDLLTVIAEGDLRSDGCPAKRSAEQRAGMWLDAGADLVLQLPVFSVLGGYGKKDFAVAALIQRLHSAERVILPCRHLPGQTAEECGELLRRCAMLMFRERPDYRKELQENLRRRMPFLRAQMEAVAFCIPEAAGLLQLPENRQSVCMLDAMLQLYYIVRVDFMETESGAEDTSISAAGNRAPGGRTGLWEDHTQTGSAGLREGCAQGGRAGSPSGGEERRRLCFERRAARELKKMLENQSRDFLMNISGSTERAVSRILDISGEIWEGTCLQEIVERVEAAFPNRDMARLFLLRIVLNIRHSDMLISGLYTYVPYCRVLGERGQRQDEIGRIEELSWVPFIRETGSGQSREDSPGQGGQADETLRLLLAIDRRAGLLFG